MWMMYDKVWGHLALCLKLELHHVNCAHFRLTQLSPLLSPVVITWPSLLETPMLLFNGMFQMWSHACKICKTRSARVNLRNTEGISLNCVLLFFFKKIIILIIIFTERSVMGWSVFLLCLAQDSPRRLCWMSLPYRETPSGRLRLYSTTCNHDKNKALAASCHPHGHANMQTPYRPPQTRACTSTWTLMGKVLEDQPPHMCTHLQ